MTENSLLSTNYKVMKHLLLLLSLFGLVSCSNSMMELNDSDKDKILQTIDNHEKTLIFIWAEYCHAGKQMLDKNIVPYLDGLEKNDVGIVLLYYGRGDFCDGLKSDNRLVITNGISTALLIKINANNTMKKIVKNFKTSNYSPIPLLVDRNGFALNYNEESGHYDYTEIFEVAK